MNERGSFGFDDLDTPTAPHLTSKRAKAAKAAKAATAEAAQSTGFNRAGGGEQKPIVQSVSIATPTPAKSRIRRRRTGRNAQLGIRSTVEAVQTLYRISDETGMGLGETAEWLLAHENICPICKRTTINVEFPDGDRIAQVNLRMTQEAADAFYQLAEVNRWSLGMVLESLLRKNSICGCLAV